MKKEIQIGWDEDNLKLLYKFLKYHADPELEVELGLFLFSVKEPLVFVQKYSSDNMKSKIGTSKNGIDYLDGTKVHGGALLITPDDYQYRFAIPITDEWVSRGLLMDCIVELGIQNREDLEFESDRKDKNIMIRGCKVASFGRLMRGDVSIEVGSIHWKFDEELNKSVFDTPADYFADYCCNTPKIGLEDVSGISREVIFDLWMSKIDNYMNSIEE